MSGVVLGMTLSAGAAFAAPPGTVPFGVYDPAGDFSQNRDVSIEMIFLPWEGVDLDSLRAADAYAVERNRDLLVTVEPWAWGAPHRPETLRDGILTGRHDATMRSVCSVVGTLQSPVTVRWAQEMDNPNGHFPWAMWRPDEFVEAYRRMVGVCRSVAPDARFMWSPAGEPGLEAYYPGDDVVDVIGLSVFGEQNHEIAEHGTEYGFAEILGPRYDRAVTFGKPIMVAELGFAGDAAYLARWHNAVRRQHEQFAELTGVIYYNRQEVWPWPNDIGLPDWRAGAQLSN
ncbi:MAG: beta-mannosidase [Pararhodobacter sp.]|nr:beta-mannosidase [Pararhodobacter sp.]